MSNLLTSPYSVSNHLRVVRDEESPPYDGIPSAPVRERTDPFVMVPVAIGETILGTLGPSAFAVYWHLAKRSRDGTCWPSLDDIADGVSLSRMHVTRMLNALEADGWISREKRSNKRGLSTSTLYRLIGNPCTDACNIRVTSHEHRDVVDVTRTRVELDVNQNVVTPPTPSPGEPAKRSRKRKDYTEDFEAFWQAYPKDHGTKSLAFTEWQKLDGDDQAAAVASLPAFKASRRWQEGYIRDAERFLKYRQWESPPARNGSANGMEIDWKTATPEQKESYRLTRERDMLRQL